MKKISKMNEWELALTHRDALKVENYELCRQIQEEVDLRIKNGTINHSFMNGFKAFNPKTQQFYGNPKFEPYNGLFKNYRFQNEALH